MTVIDKLKEAIISERWDIVKEVFQDFGGKIDDIELSPKINREGLISDNNIQKALSEPVVKRQSNDDYLSPIKNSSVRKGSTYIDKDGKERKLADVEPLDISKSKINIFSDDGTMASEDKKFDKTVILKSPVNRLKRDSELVSATCKSCGNSAKVLPMFAAHYRCDRCMVAR